MSEERKEFDEPYLGSLDEYDVVRSKDGKDMSVNAPAFGSQRAIVEGPMGAARSKLLRDKETTESSFRAQARKYLEQAYPNMNPSQRFVLIDRAVSTPEYYNLAMNILLAAILFWENAGQVPLTPELFRQYAPAVLEPIIQDLNVRHRIDYEAQLDADLLRYLRIVRRPSEKY